MQVRSLGQEGPLEKEMAAHSSILAWEIPWTEEMVGSRSWVQGVVKESDMTEQLNNKVGLRETFSSLEWGSWECI